MEISITLTYNTDDANDLIYYALELKNTDSGSWVKTVVDGNINGDGSSPLAVNTDTEITLTLSIPSDEQLSSALTGQHYEFKIEVQNGWAWQAGSTGYYGTFTISNTASIAGLETLPARVYPNPTKGMLHFASDESFQSFKVFNVVGILVEENETEPFKTIDVSHLNTGLYFLQIDSFKPIQFVKQ